MELLKHFQSTTKKDFIIFALKDNEWDEFLNKLPENYKDCFISEEDLKNLISLEENKSRKNVLLNRIPTKGSIESGDFGEILSYFIFKELYKNDKVNGPKKWRWKEHNNKAAPGSDIVLYSVNNIKKPSANDLLLTVESKAKATKGTENPIQKAVVGAIDDFGQNAIKDSDDNITDWKNKKVSRLANTLPWLIRKYEDELLKISTNKEDINEEIKKINRFIKSEIFGEYRKKINAVALIDKDFINDEIIKSITKSSDPNLDLEIFIIGIKDLKIMYKKVYSEILNL